VTAPVTRVEWLMRDANHETFFGYESAEDARETAKENDRLYPEDAPHVVIERTITERVLAPAEEG
jgi:hypothetical protein